LIELDLSCTSITDEGLAHLKGHKKLVRLSLDDTPVTDAGLAHLAGLKGLTVLMLNGTKVSDAGLAHLKATPLKVLRIDNTGITDLTPLKGMALEEIRLTPKNITKGLDILREMKSLKTIGISWEQGWPAAEFWKRSGKGEFKE
jgi:Leucine-rich repeat (LRR) protein